MAPQIPHMKARSHPGKRRKLSGVAPGCELNARRAVSHRTSGEKFAAGSRKLEAETTRPWRQTIRARPAESWMLYLPIQEQHDREFVEAEIRGYEVLRAEYARHDRMCSLDHSREDHGWRTREWQDPSILRESELFHPLRALPREKSDPRRSNGHPPELRPRHVLSSGGSPPEAAGGLPCARCLRG